MFRRRIPVPNDALHYDAVKEADKAVRKGEALNRRLEEISQSGDPFAELAHALNEEAMRHRLQRKIDDP